jgi:hypothetical protein
MLKPAKDLGLKEIYYQKSTTVLITLPGRCEVIAQYQYAHIGP